jgi:predicted nucleic acid-binding protein
MALCAPDIILAEVGNALWKAVRAKHLHADIASKHLAKVPELFDDLVPPSRLYEAAFNLGVLLNHPIYDCFYLALARCERSPLVTADKRLAAVARSLADVEVRLLEAR